MRILIIAEGRTGGTTLMDYFEKVFSEYEIITEPYTNKKDWIENNDITNIEWYKKYDNVIVKEIFDDTYDFNNFINSSDKVICIYRKNWYEQVKSVLYAEHVKKFSKNYNIEDVNNVVTEKMIYDRYLYRHRKLKKLFIDFIKNNNFVNVSYEDLYYGNGIDIIKNYLNIEDKTLFPPTKKYLKDNNGVEIVPTDEKKYNDYYLDYLELELLKKNTYQEPKKIIKKPKLI